MAQVVNDPYEEYTCPLCLEPLRSTRTFEECGHNFCAECICTKESSGGLFPMMSFSKTLKPEIKSCPTCRNTNCTVVKNVQIDRKIANLPYTCPHCSKTFEYSKKDDHEKHECFFTRVIKTSKINEVKFCKDCKCVIPNDRF